MYATIGNIMGACLSSGTGHPRGVDDSLNVMLSRDRRRRNENGAASGPTNVGYSPRAANPVLERTNAGGNSGGEEKKEDK